MADANDRNASDILSYSERFRVKCDAPLDFVPTRRSSLGHLRIDPKLAFCPFFAPNQGPSGLFFELNSAFVILYYALINFMLVLPLMLCRSIQRPANHSAPGQFLMTQEKRHVLAAFDDETGHLLYRSANEGWTEDVEKARGFSCKREANDYLHQYNLTEHRVPFQLVSVPVYEAAEPQVVASSTQDSQEPLCTGIYG